MKKFNYKLLLLFPLAILLKYLSSLSSSITETFYSLSVNKVTIEVLSKFTNFIPFSLYDITIIVTILSFLVYFIFALYYSIKKKLKFFKTFKIVILNCLTVISIAYFLFIALWALNYNRVTFDKTIGIENNKHSINDLSNLYKYLISNVNELRQQVEIDNNNIATISAGYKSVLNRASIAYDITSQDFPTLHGNYGSPKPLLFSEFFNYTGITGIYFPYSGQPGVNVNIPLMSLPVTTLHEMAHQRGYAQEDEANFIAFLTSINHPDSDFKYSGYLLALSYTSNALYMENPELLKKLNETLSLDVKRDIIYKRDFWKKYEGKINDISSNINDSYLKSNGVADGEKSYGRMVDLLLNYCLENKLF